MVRPWICSFPAGRVVLLGKRERHASAAAQFALGPEGAAVERGDALGDSQARKADSGELDQPPATEREGCHIGHI